MTRAVSISPAQIRAFRRTWPCSGLPTDVGLSATFAANGDLESYEWADGADYYDAELSGAMVALLNDARDGRLSE
jgi:hypothetical protein